MIKKIHQIYISDDNSPSSEFVIEKTQSLKKLYFDYEYKLWHKNEIEIFLDTHSKPFGPLPKDILKYFNKLKPNAFKCDLARYSILYVLGGYYFDVTLCPEFKLEVNKSTVFKGVSFYDDKKIYNKKNITSNDSNKILYEVIENNVLMFPVKNDIFLEEAINSSCLNIKHSYYLDHPLSVTSPILLARLKKNSHLNLGHCKIDKNLFKDIYGHKALYYEDKLFCKFKPMIYKDFTNLKGKGTNDYAVLWHSRELYNYASSFEKERYESTAKIKEF